MDRKVALPEYEELKKAVEGARLVADGRSKLRAKFAVGVLLAIAALLTVAALAFAAPLALTAAVHYTYAPGATVAVVRITVSGVANTTYSVEVRGPANETVAVKEVQADANGTAVLELELPEIYPAGVYTVYVAGGGEFATATFVIAWNATGAAPNATTIPGAKVAAANLIRVAAKLSAMVHCRNEVLLAANVTQTELEAVFQAALNLTRAGDDYLALANSSLAAGNYTAAMRYAQLAIQNFGRALELQEDLKEQLGVSFAACKAVIAPPKEAPAPAKNATCKWTPEFYPLMTAFNVTEHRVEELRELLAKLEERGYNVTGLAVMLDQASSLVEEGRRLALACNVSEAAHKLADARKYIGAVDAAIAKLGGMRFVKEVKKAGIEVNETEVREALKKGKISEKIVEKINETLRKLLTRMEEMKEKDLKEIEKITRNIEKLSEKVEKEKQVPMPKVKEIKNRVEELRRNIEREKAARKGKP